MESTSSTAIAEPYREAGHIRLMPGPRELAAIAAFWAAYALLTLANRIFDQGGPSGLMTGRVTVAALEALCWTILTPILFALVGRVDLESSRSRYDRWVGLLIIALVTVASAALLGLVGRELRELFTPLPAGRGGRGGGPPAGVRLWFGFFNSLILALGVVAVGVARAYSLRLRSRRDQAIQLTNQLTEARLDALRRQLDPHFLFNTLNAIAEWCRDDGEVAERAVLQLSAMLRTVLEGVHAPSWSLREEMSLVATLFALHGLRDPDRIRFVQRLPEPLPEVAVPPMLFLPPADNAVKHGVTAGHGGDVVLAVESASAGQVIVRLENDGVFGGRRVGGLGLDMVERRLALAYDGRATFRIAASGTRTVAEVSFPTGVAPQEERERVRS
jgi:hypothetical protein